MPTRTATKERTASSNGTRSRTSKTQNLPAEIQTFMREHGDKLSATARRAKWIMSPSDKADRKGQTLITRDHNVIQQWAAARDATPSTAGEVKSRPRVLRMDFPGYGGDGLTHIEWDDWFRTFDERHLVFLYQEQLKSGDQSNFFRLDNPDK